MKKEKRKAVGIVLDFSLRVPDFKETYTVLKEEILIGMKAGENLDQGDIQVKKKIDMRNYWNLLQEKNPKAVDFYIQTPTPTSNYGKDFDLTYKKYFFNEEHRLKFLEDWSYNLYGQGTVTNKADINIINIAQTKLFDVVLIDRVTHIRKVSNTYAFLSRAGIFTKSCIFVNTQEEIEQLEKDLIAIWDPFKNNEQVISPSSHYGQPTEKFVDWFMDLESKNK